MELTKRQKITHLLNRFGLGANEHEVEEYAGLGVDGAIKRLLNFDTLPERFDIKPTEFFFEADPKNPLQMDSSRVALWWILRMILSDQPGQEKLAMFWHSHFAVSGAKIGYAPMMLQYLEVLSSKSKGKFADLLTAMSKSPAMIVWLDTDKSLKGKPNENFAREVMELFTLGIGNYSEADIQHSCKAYSGWSVRYPIGELGNMPQPERVRWSWTNDVPMVAFQDAPDMHDNTEKEFLGKKGNFSAEDILSELANHPKTAERICTRLWEFYAYASPERSVIERLTSVYAKSEGSIMDVLYAITASPEFWSEKAVGTMVKSPIDFCIGALRQVKAGAMLHAKRLPSAKFDTPIHRGLLGDLYTVNRFLSNQGLRPLYPLDVSGWKWGSYWATPAAMLERAKYPNFVFGPGDANGPISAYFLDRLIENHKAAGPEEIVDEVLKCVGCAMSLEKKAILIALCKKLGGSKLLSNRRQAAGLVRSLSRIIFSSPEYQLC